MFVHVRKKQAPNVVGVRLITFSPSIHRLILFLTTYPALGAKGRRGSGGVNLGVRQSAIWKRQLITGMT